MNYFSSGPTAQAAFAELQQVSRDSVLVQGDVTSAPEVDRLCREIEQALGNIDVVVVNATCSQPQLSVEEYDWEFYQTMLDFFVKSPVLLTKRCLPNMRQKGWGRFIHLTSEVFDLAAAPFSAYVAAKGGQTGLAR